MKLDIKFDPRALVFGMVLLTFFTAVIVKGAVLDTLERFSKTENK